MGPKLIKCCMPEPMGTKDFGKIVKNNPNIRGRESPSQRGKKLQKKQREEHEKGEKRKREEEKEEKEVGTGKRRCEGFRNL